MIGIVFCTLLAAAISAFILFQDVATLEQSALRTHKVMHITDPHIDIFFDPRESVPEGSQSSSSGNANANSSFNCPSEEDVVSHVSKVQNTDFTTTEQGDYLFGRYGCDPPLLLWTSLLAAMQRQDSSPSVVVFTGQYRRDSMLSLCLCLCLSEFRVRCLRDV